MKRTAQATLDVILIVLVSAAVSAAPLKVKVTKITGNVMVQKAGAADWTRAADNMALQKGAQVKTASGGSCILAWENGNVVKLNELSSLAIEESAKQGLAGNTTVKINNGKMYARVEKLSATKSDFTIKTPTAVAGVRGSEIIVTAEPGVSSFQVLDGAFAVASEGQEILLDQNFQVDVPANEPPPPPVQIPTDQLNDLKIEADQVKTEASEIQMQFEEEEGGQDASSQEEESDGTEAAEDTDGTDQTTAALALENIEDDIIEQETVNETINQISEFEPGTGGAVVVIE